MYKRKEVTSFRDQGEPVQMWRTFVLCEEPTSTKRKILRNRSCTSCASLIAGEWAHNKITALIIVFPYFCDDCVRANRRPLKNRRPHHRNQILHQGLKHTTHGLSPPRRNTKQMLPISLSRTIKASRSQDYDRCLSLRTCRGASHTFSFPSQHADTLLPQRFCVQRSNGQGSMSQTRVISHGWYLKLPALQTNSDRKIGLTR